MLRLERVNSFYGPVQVHFDLELRVESGEIVSLLGGNASGKSTAMKVVLGLVRPKSGEVWLDGEKVTGLPTPEIIKRGVASVPEARRIFGDMTVRENLLLGAYLRRDRDGIERDYEQVLELFPRLRERLRVRGGVLSGGEQQMLAMGRALMSRPRLICMDEPTMGLSPRYVDEVLGLIQEINRQGVAVFMVEQNANLALQIAHRGYVLREGRIALEGRAEELRGSRQVQEAYLAGAGSAQAVVARL